MNLLNSLDLGTDDIIAEKSSLSDWWRVHQLRAAFSYLVLPQAAEQSIKANIRDTLFPLVILSFHNQQDEDICFGCQTLRSLWITAHAPPSLSHTHTMPGLCPFPIKTFVIIVYFPRCSSQFRSAPCRAIPDCDPGAAFLVPAAAWLPGIKILAVLHVALCTSEAFQRDGGWYRFASVPAGCQLQPS